MPGPDAEGGLHYLLDTFKFPAYGEVTFYCRDAEYLWQVPVGVTSISAVLIGGGGGGGAGGGQCQRSGGGGGGLRWINGMPVAPGETLRIKVGHGGTANFTSTLVANSQFWWNNPGEDSYIASNNNANVAGRTGIGGTIIVFAQGGGQFPLPPTTGRGSVEGRVSNNNQDVLATAGIGTSGGTGSTTGTFAWGTIGGGNGGHGGRGRGTGGGVSGAGAGAGGFTGNGGNGGEADANGNSAGGTAGGNGSGGGGGGGNAAIGGGANAGGGGGGVGMYWGIGANGLGANQNYPETTLIFNSWPGQGGSFGADGKAPGNELYFLEVGGPYTYPSKLDGPPPSYTYDNGSISNGIRGYQASLDDATDEAGANASGGLYGGGGGGTDSSSEKPRAGAGACGVVRIIYQARPRQGITRNYPGGYNTSLTITQNVNNGWSGINTTNILTNYGYPTLPPVAGGPPPITGEYYA